MLLNEFVTNITALDMFEPGETVVLGVSGGPDSVCLAIVLDKVAKQIDLKLCFAHLDHQFRGEESQNDATFVQRLADRLGWPVAIKTVNMPKLLAKKRGSSQALSREIRYNFLRTVADSVNTKKIILGHNKNDQAETLLINLLRGAGVEGLTAMAFSSFDEQGYALLRPLLKFDRKQIIALLANMQQDYRVDSSNLGDKYQRNHVRHHLIPYLEEHYNPNVTQSLFNTAAILHTENDYINEQVSIWCKKYLHKNNNTVILSCKSVLEQHEAVINRICRQAYAAVVGNTKDISYDHVQEMKRVISASHGEKIQLPKGIVCEKVYQQIMLYPFTAQVKLANKHVMCLAIPGSNKFPGGQIITSVRDRDTVVLKKDPKVASLNWDILKDKSLIVRTRQPGDQFTPLGMKGSKKLKDFFIDEKVPYFLRDNIPLLVTEQEELIWVIPYRINDAYKVTPQTKQVLVCEFERRE